MSSDEGAGPSSAASPAPVRPPSSPTQSDEQVTSAEEKLVELAQLTEPELEPLTELTQLTEQIELGNTRAKGQGDSEDPLPDDKLVAELSNTQMQEEVECNDVTLYKYRGFRLVLKRITGHTLPIYAVLLLPRPASLEAMRIALMTSALAEKAFDVFFPQWTLNLYVTRNDENDRILHIVDSDEYLNRLLSEERKAPGLLAIRLEQCKNKKYSRFNRHVKGRQANIDNTPVHHAGPSRSSTAGQLRIPAILAKKLLYGMKTPGSEVSSAPANHGRASRNSIRSSFQPWMSGSQSAPESARLYNRQISGNRRNTGSDRRRQQSSSDERRCFHVLPEHDQYPQGSLLRNTVPIQTSGPQAAPLGQRVENSRRAEYYGPPSGYHELRAAPEILYCQPTVQDHHVRGWDHEYTTHHAFGDQFLSSNSAASAFTQPQDNAHLLEPIGFRMGQVISYPAEIGDIRHQQGVNHKADMSHISLPLGSVQALDHRIVLPPGHNQVHGATYAVQLQAGPPVGSASHSIPHHVGENADVSNSVTCKFNMKAGNSSRTAPSQKYPGTAQFPETSGYMLRCQEVGTRPGCPNQVDNRYSNNTSAAQHQVSLQSIQLRQHQRNMLAARNNLASVQQHQQPLMAQSSIVEPGVCQRPSTAGEMVSNQMSTYSSAHHDEPQAVDSGAGKPSNSITSQQESHVVTDQFDEDRVIVHPEPDQRIDSNQSDNGQIESKSSNRNAPNKSSAMVYHVDDNQDSGHQDIAQPTNHHQENAYQNACCPQPAISSTHQNGVRPIDPENNAPPFNINEMRSQFSPTHFDNPYYAASQQQGHRDSPTSQDCNSQYANSLQARSQPGYDYEADYRLTRHHQGIIHHQATPWLHPASVQQMGPQTNSEYAVYPANFQYPYAQPIQVYPFGHHQLYSHRTSAQFLPSWQMSVQPRTPCCPIQPNTRPQTEN